MINLFEHFETLNRQERESIATELVYMYNAAIDNEHETYATLRRATKPEYHSAQANYYEAIGKLSMLQGVFDLLGIPFECGQMIEI